MHQVADEHFADITQQHEALRLGMWAFLASEVLLFGGVLTLYAAYRIEHPAGFSEGSAKLYQSIGLVNTAVLLASSFAMVKAVRAVHAGRARSGATRLLTTAAIGVVFLLIKALEYWLDACESILPGVRFDASSLSHPEGAEQFLTLYLVVTGLHAAHMVAGVVAVASTALLLRAGRVRTGPASPVEAVGLYWHFVDIVWVFLLPLLYLV